MGTPVIRRSSSRRARRLSPALSACLVALLLLLAVARPAQAHAELVHANPAAGDALTSFPSLFTLAFSERVDAGAARAKLLDERGMVIADGSIRQGDNDQTLLVSLPPQPDGIYTLAWQVVSSDDGHITEGTLPFSVGADTPRVSLLPPPGAPDPAETLPSPVETFLRWIGYLSLSLVVGGIAFSLLVWRPGRMQHPSDSPAIDEHLMKLRLGLVRWGALGVGISVIAVTVWQAVEAGNAVFSDPFVLRLVNAFSHHGPGVLWIQILLVPIVYMMASLTPVQGSDTTRHWLMLAYPAAILLVTFPFESHSAATGQALPILGDGLHLLSMSLWIGGLVPLAITLWQYSRSPEETGSLQLSDAVRRFSTLALVAILVLAFTGVYSALWQVRTVDALTATSYGQTVMVKIGLLAVLVALGAFNRFALVPRLSKTAASALDCLYRTVRAEVALGALALLAAGVLLSLPPAYSELQSAYNGAFEQSWQGENVRLTLLVAPASVGRNEFGVEASDRRSGAGSGPPRALLVLSPVDGSARPVTLELKPDGRGRFTATSDAMNTLVIWRAHLTWQSPGLPGVTHDFLIDLPSRFNSGAP